MLESFSLVIIVGFGKLNIQSMNVLIPSTCFDFTGRTSFQPETDLLAKAKITHTLSHQGYLTQMMSVLYTQGTRELT